MHIEQLRKSAEAPTSLSSAQISVTLVMVSEGVQIVRNGKTFPANCGHALSLHDRVVVPEGAHAQAAFQGKEGQCMLSTFDGGSAVSLVYFRYKNGACSVVFDVHFGRVEMSMSSKYENTVDENPIRQAIGFHCYSKPLRIG